MCEKIVEDRIAEISIILTVVLGFSQTNKTDFFSTIRTAVIITFTYTSAVRT